MKPFRNWLNCSPDCCRWEWSDVRWFLRCWAHEARWTTDASVTLQSSTSQHQETSALRQHRNSVVSTIR